MNKNHQHVIIGLSKLRHARCDADDILGINNTSFRYMRVHRLEQQGHVMDTIDLHGCEDIPAFRNNYRILQSLSFTGYRLEISDLTVIVNVIIEQSIQYKLMETNCHFFARNLFSNILVISEDIISETVYIRTRKV